MAEFSRMRAEMEALREENARLRGGSAASAQGGYATPSSPERPAEEITEAQDEGIDAVYGADWSQAGGPAVSGAGGSAAETHEVNAAREAADTIGRHVEEFSVQASAPTSATQQEQPPGLGAAAHAGIAPAGHPGGGHPHGGGVPGGAGLPGG
eukprot:7422190-Pyramimonas_sp.AAC.1